MSKINKYIFLLVYLLPRLSLNIPDHWGPSRVYVLGQTFTFNFFYSYTIFMYWLHYLITFYILNMVQFLCKFTIISCFMVKRVRNQTKSRLVIYVNNTLCPGKHRKKTSKEHCLTWHTPHHIHTINSLGRSGENEITYVYVYYYEFYTKFTCLTSYFYLIN